MKKGYLYIAALLVFGILMGSFVSAEETAQKANSIVVNSVFRQNGEKCTTLIVGKEATTDGAVLLGHNEDLGGNSAQHMIVVPRKIHQPGEVFVLYSGGSIPQMEETYAYIATTLFDVDYIPGTITSGINEYQVSIGNNMSYSRDELIPPEGNWSLKYNGIIWTEFTQIALERAKSAKEAVQIMGQLSEQYGLSGDPGTAFGITDSNEGWFIEIPRGGQWVAKRVPDDGYAMMANTFRICEIEDEENFMHSGDLVDFAIDNGFYDPDGGEPFCFAEVYGNLDRLFSPYNTRRHWRVENLLGGIVPGASPADIMSILRDHYEGTEYDLTNGYEISPHHTSERTVCKLRTEASIVAQLRNWLPAEIGGVAWWALVGPCSSVYVPWYMGIQKVPYAYQIGTNEYDGESAYWAFGELSQLVDENYGNLIGDVKKAWAQFEAKEFAQQKGIEKAALKIYYNKKELARSFLTGHSNRLGMKAVKKAKQMTKRFE